MDHDFADQWNQQFQPTEPAQEAQSQGKKAMPSATLGTFMLTLDEDNNGQHFVYAGPMEQPGQDITSIIEERRRLSSMALSYQEGKRSSLPENKLILTCA